MLLNIKKKFFIIFFLLFLIIYLHQNTCFNLTFVNLSIESKLWPAAYTFYITINNNELEKISAIIISHFDENIVYIVTLLFYRIVLYLYAVFLNFFFSDKNFLLVLICNIFFSYFFFWIIFCLKDYSSFFAFNVLELQIGSYYDFFSSEKNLVNSFFLILLGTCFVLFITCLNNFVYSIMILYILFSKYYIIIINMCCLYPFTIFSLFFSHFCVFYIYISFIDKKRLSSKKKSIVLSNSDKNDFLQNIEYFKMYLKDFTLSLIFTIFLYYVIAQNVDSIWNQLYIDIDPINYLILIKSYCTPTYIEIAQFLNEKIAALEKDHLPFYLNQVKPLQQTMLMIFLSIFFLTDFIFYLLEKIIIELIYFLFFLSPKDYKKNKKH